MYPFIVKLTLDSPCDLCQKRIDNSEISATSNLFFNAMNLTLQMLFLVMFVYIE